MNECSICLEPIRASNESLTLECCHKYHVDCIKRWKQNNESCPLCRDNLHVSEDMFGIQNMNDEDFSKLRKFFRL
jgi:hypothetical protein